MNRYIRTFSIFSMVLFVSIGISYAQQDGNRNRGQNNSKTSLMRNLPTNSTTALPDEIVLLVIDGWEDEQHAAAVYNAVLDQFGELRPFKNILQSEYQHIAAWETIMERYNIAIPEFTAPELDDFSSFSEACILAAEAEISNVALYATMFDAFAEYPDLLYVATALQTASQNQHLPAFERCSDN